MNIYPFTASVPFGPDRKIEDVRSDIERALENAGGSDLQLAQRGEHLSVRFQIPGTDEGDAADRGADVVGVVFAPGFDFGLEGG